MPTFAPVERLWDSIFISAGAIDVGVVVGDEVDCVTSVNGADVVGIEELEVVSTVLENKVEVVELEVAVAPEAELEESLLSYISQTSSVIFFVLAKSAAEHADFTHGATSAARAALFPQEHVIFLTVQPTSANPEVRQLKEHVGREAINWMMTCEDAVAINAAPIKLLEKCILISRFPTRT